MRCRTILGVFGVLACVAGLSGLPESALGDKPIATDSRIRTFVYGENEVFQVTTKYGYQSNIEFGPTEQIETLSVGDPVAFKVTPAGNRIFIKAMEEDRHTNMTVVTDLRAYQFEISSVVEREEDLVYVMRFYYPEKDFDAKPESAHQEFSSKQVVQQSYNFNYSLNGPDYIAPVRVFDDGRFTFFKFPDNNRLVPDISAVHPDGEESPVISRVDGEYIVIENVYSQFALRGDGGDIVCVFNDSAVPYALGQ